jgi:hypothetical protein
LVRFFAPDGARLPFHRELRTALDAERDARFAADARAEDADARANKEAMARASAEAEVARLRRQLDALREAHGDDPPTRSVVVR